MNRIGEVKKELRRRERAEQSQNAKAAARRTKTGAVSKASAQTRINRGSLVGSVKSYAQN